MYLYFYTGSFSLDDKQYLQKRILRLMNVFADSIKTKYVFNIEQHFSHIDVHSRIIDLCNGCLY